MLLLQVMMQVAMHMYVSAAYTQEGHVRRSIRR